MDSLLRNESTVPKLLATLVILLVTLSYSELNFSLIHYFTLDPTHL
jgi:hypothetical protein